MYREQKAADKSCIPQDGPQDQNVSLKCDNMPQRMHLDLQSL